MGIVVVRAHGHGTLIHRTLGKLFFRAVDTPGNVTPMAEFNFRADPDAADIVMGTSKGFKHSPEGYSTRLVLIEQGKQAPMHVVVLPLSSKSYPCSNKDNVC